MRMNRKGGHTHLLENHFKTWLREAYLEKEETSLPKPEKWMKLVDMVHFMWDHGTIPTGMVFIILILIPKVNSDTQEKGLLEVIWKVMDAINDTRIKKSVKFHAILRGFCAGRGMGTDIVELNIVEDLTSV